MPVTPIHASLASDHHRLRTFAGDPCALIASLLPNARVVGDGWRADCPMGHRSKGTVSLAGGTDGRALLKCHAGCGAAEILSAIGLGLADLFPRRLEPMTPRLRRELSEAGRLARKGAALAAVGYELAIVEVAATEMIANPGEPLSLEDFERLSLALDRISAARKEINR